MSTYIFNENCHNCKLQIVYSTGKVVAYSHQKYLLHLHITDFSKYNHHLSPSLKPFSLISFQKPSIPILSTPTSLLLHIPIHVPPRTYPLSATLQPSLSLSSLRSTSKRRITRDLLALYNSLFPSKTPACACSERLVVVAQRRISIITRLVGRYLYPSMTRGPREGLLLYTFYYLLLSLSLFLCAREPT